MIHYHSNAVVVGSKRHTMTAALPTLKQQLLALLVLQLCETLTGMPAACFYMCLRQLLAAHV